MMRVPGRSRRSRGGPFLFGQVEHLLPEFAKLEVLLQHLGQPEDRVGGQIEELFLPRRRHARAADADDARLGLLFLEGEDQVRAMRVAAGFARDHENDRGPFGMGRLGSAHGRGERILKSAARFAWRSAR
jgi:hypothetical protein